MSRVVYVNGRYLPYARARIHVEDRGFQFADAVYEVIEVHGGALVDTTRHFDRLWRSLGELRIKTPCSRASLTAIVSETLRRNLVANGLVYLQVTRGAAPRDFAFPIEAVKPSLIVIARSQPAARTAALAGHGIAVKTMPDMRWGRCDIKTVMLLPACLAKDAAKADGAREVWFLDSRGNVTEGGSSNAWIITERGVLVTRPLGRDILAGVTRATVFDCAAKLGYKIEERAFSRAEALQAREAFITAATNTVMPVVSIDGQAVGTGKPGAMTLNLRQNFHQTAEIMSA